MPDQREKTEKKGVFTARSLCYTAVAAAILTVCAWLAFPLGDIPVTLQTFGVCFVGGLLGSKRGTLAVAAYLLLGFIGVPVFAGFTGGAAKLLSPTGGYLIGFLFIAFFSGLPIGRTRFVGMLAGLLICYLFGTVWFAVWTAQNAAAVGVWTALTLCVFPYLPFDIAKLALAALLTRKLRKFLK